MGLVTPALRSQRGGQKVCLGGLIGAISHLAQHLVGRARLAFSSLVVLREHLDQHRDIGTVGAEMPKAKVVHHHTS